MDKKIWKKLLTRFRFVWVAGGLGSVGESKLFCKLWSVRWFVRFANVLAVRGQKLFFKSAVGKFLKPFGSVCVSRNES